jgi:hypothetical protein
MAAESAITGRRAMSANLTYYIFEGTLTGQVGGKFFHIEALSGGAGGSTNNKPSDAVNNPYMEGLKTVGSNSAVGHRHGGPIPPGRYTIVKPSHHPHLGLSAQLTHPRWRPMGRDGFYIHGRGPHGSDGCIVPLNHARFVDLMDALTKSGGGVLAVQETMDGVRFA